MKEVCPPLAIDLFINIIINVGNRMLNSLF